MKFIFHQFWINIIIKVTVGLNEAASKNGFVLFFCHLMQ